MLKKSESGLDWMLANSPDMKNLIAGIKRLPKKADFGNAMTSVPNSLSALMRNVQSQPGTTKQNSLMKANMLRSTFNANGKGKEEFPNVNNMFLRNALTRLLEKKQSAVKTADGFGADISSLRLQQDKNRYKVEPSKPKHVDTDVRSILNLADPQDKWLLPLVRDEKTINHYIDSGRVTDAIDRAVQNAKQTDMPLTGENTLPNLVATQSAAWALPNAARLSNYLDLLDKFPVIKRIAYPAAATTATGVIWNKNLGTDIPNYQIHRLMSDKDFQKDTAKLAREGNEKAIQSLRAIYSDQGQAALVPENHSEYDGNGLGRGFRGLVTLGSYSDPRPAAAKAATPTFWQALKSFSPIQYAKYAKAFSMTIPSIIEPLFWKPLRDPVDDVKRFASDPDDYVADYLAGPRTYKQYIHRFVNPTPSFLAQQYLERQSLEDSAKFAGKVNAKLNERQNQIRNDPFEIKPGDTYWERTAKALGASGRR
jgi:hypothetical protein